MNAGSLGAYQVRNVGAVLEPITSKHVLSTTAMGALAGIAAYYAIPNLRFKVGKENIINAGFYAGLGALLIGGTAGSIAAWQRS